jgi:hypothetical protein
MTTVGAHCCVAPRRLALPCAVFMRNAPLIAVVLVASCATAAGASRDPLVERAVFDLSCPANELKGKEIDERTWAVWGCGRRATYVKTCKMAGFGTGCPANEIPSREREEYCGCTWLMNTADGDATQRVASEPAAADPEAERSEPAAAPDRLLLCCEHAETGESGKTLRGCRTMSSTDSIASCTDAGYVFTTCNDALCTADGCSCS